MYDSLNTHWEILLLSLTGCNRLVNFSLDAVHASECNAYEASQGKILRPNFLLTKTEYMITIPRNPQVSVCNEEHFPTAPLSCLPLNLIEFDCALWGLQVLPML